MENNLAVGALYEHYKGNQYRIIAFAKHSETLEELVIYEDTKDTSTRWARPRSIFFESIEKEGKSIPRFRYISN